MLIVGQQALQRIQVPLFAVVLSGGVCAVLVISGMRVGESGLAGVVVLCEGLIGAAIWASVRKPWQPHGLELLAAGTLVGMCLFVAIDQALVALAAEALRLPFILLGGLSGAACLLIPQGTAGSSVARGTIGKSVILIMIAVGAAGAFQIEGWRRFPLYWSAAGTFGTDIAFHEAVANSISEVGPLGNFMALGHRLSYHWFSHAWAGSTAAAIDAQSFAVITRVVPLVAVSVSLILVGVIIRDWSGHRIDALVACVCTLALGSHAAWSVLTPVSPAQIFATPMVLLSVWIYLLMTKGRLRAGALMLPIAVFVCVLSKVNSIVLLAGLGVALVVRLIQRRLKWPEFATVGCAAVLSLVALALESEEQGKNGLGFSFSQTAEYLRLGLPTFRLSVAISAVLAALTLMAPWLGTLLFLAKKEGRQLAQPWLAVGMGASAVILATFLAQSGRSQLNFVMTAGIVVLPISIWGICAAWRELVPSATRTALTWGTGLAGALSIVITPRAISLAVIAVLAVVLMLVSIFMGADKRLLFGLGAAVLALSAASTFALTQTLNYATSPVRSEEQLEQSPTNSVTASQREALQWIRRHVPEKAIVATNRFCDDINLIPPECMSVQFDVSAVGRRQTLLEGFTYSAGEPPLPTWAVERINDSLDFVSNPGPSTWHSLAIEHNVGWVYVDKRLAHAAKWEPWGNVRFENMGAAVIELAPQRPM